MQTNDEYYARRERLGFKTVRPVVRVPVLRLAAPEPIQEVKQPEPEEEVETPNETYYTLPHMLPKRILAEVCAKHGLTLKELRTKKRTRRFLDARQEAAYLLASQTNLSYQAIAQKLGYFDHTTSLAAARRYADNFGLPRIIKIEDRSQLALRNQNICTAAEIGVSYDDLAKVWNLDPKTVQAIHRGWLRNRPE